MLFGAGKIGRSFIAQLFSQGGYEIVFVDINSDVVDEINHRGTYDVIIRDREEKKIRVNHIRAVHLKETDQIIEEITNAAILAVSVGQKGLKDTIPILARAVIARQIHRPESPLDIIIAENMRDASEWISAQMLKILPKNFPMDSYIGLVETSIGKMVPLMTATDPLENPLDVFAEAYNILILDKLAFKNPIPGIEGLEPKDNIKAWVDRKLYIHNLGHAALAYFSFIKNSSLTYTWEALEDNEIKSAVFEAMHESAEALLLSYPYEFTIEMLEEHIDDLLRRFGNRSLGDTIFRVGCDLERKLGPYDRLVPAVKLAYCHGLSYRRILEALISGIYFDARDENGHRLPADESFLHKFNRNITEILQFHCNFEPLEFSDIYNLASCLEFTINANHK